jgi:hypothetical protein
MKGTITRLPGFRFRKLYVRIVSFRRGYISTGGLLKSARIKLATEECGSPVPSLKICLVRHEKDNSLYPEPNLKGLTERAVPHSALCITAYQKSPRNFCCSSKGNYTINKNACIRRPTHLHYETNSTFF